MTIYIRTTISIGERLFITAPYLRQDACAALQVRVDTKLQHALHFDLESLIELHGALLEGDFEKILAREPLSLIVVPRPKRGLLLGIVDERDDALLRSIHVNARSREQLVRGCEHARAAAADPALFSAAVEDARIAREMVIV